VAIHAAEHALVIVGVAAVAMEVGIKLCSLGAAKRDPGFHN